MSCCHCDACRQRTGSVFGAQFAVARDRVAAAGPAATWSRVGDAGATVTFHRCPTCGSTVWWDISVFPDKVVVAAGAFGRVLPPAPVRTVYDERRPAWCVLPDSVTDVID